MPGRRTASPYRRSKIRQLERLEERATPAAAITPVQMRHAYGFDQLPAVNGITLTGAGQTIALVDAYYDPYAASDLATFDSTYNVPAPPTFTQVGQTGSSPATLDQDPGWGGETALDIEWAHAIAPGANILLVEATTQSLPDLMTATAFAANQPGVSVVSMSWGYPELASYDNPTYQADLSTPAGHANVSFVAASGDDSASFGLSFPAASPNVLSVGGTSLTQSNGNYIRESAWFGSGGGPSLYFPKPAYQTAYNGTVRANPDVAYDADPNTGVAVYDTYEDGLGEVGGTSDASPQWAALIALANQGRVAEGLAPLDGPSQLMPLIYSMPASNYNDITTGTNGFPATVGYDLATGLGSPKAPLVIGSMVGLGYTPPIYADTQWANLANGTAVADIDPVLAGNQPGVIGTNAFGTVDAAIAAAPVGGTVIVNGSSGPGIGNFGESVVIDKQVTLKLQEGPVSFGSLGGNVAAATINLNGITLTVGNDKTSTEYDGVITGSGGLTKIGAGTFILTGANTYTGGTTVSGGMLQVGNGGAIGSIVGAVTNNGATIAFDRSDAAFTFGGAISGSGAVLNEGSVNLTGVISGSLTVKQQSGGILKLSGANTYIAGTTVSAGTLQIGNGHALGSIIGAVQVNAGATLDLDGFNVLFGSLTLNGAVTDSAAGSSTITLISTSQYALQLFSTSSFASGLTIKLAGSTGGGILLNADAPVATLSNVGFDLGGINREISVGSGGQWKLVDVPINNGGFNLTGGGTLRLQGTAAVTNTAPITVTAGTLDLAKTSGVNAVDGDVTVAGGTLHLSASNEIADTSTITVNGGTFNLDGQTETIGALAGTGGSVSLAAGTLTVGGSSTTTYAGTIGGTGGLTLTGTGTLTLTGPNTYTGPTAVNGGTLVVNGSLANASAVTVAAGATLAGSGTVGSTTVGGTLAPGNPVGILSAGSLTMPTGGTFSESINGPSPGTGYSEVASGGPVDVTGATLNVTVGNGFNPAPGTSFDILVNKGGGPIVGTFAGLPEGATLTAAGQKFAVSYVGGSGHDIVLKALPTVASVQVNDGSAQRSEVRSLTVTFSGPVTFAGGNTNAAAAFQLAHLTDGVNVALTAAVSSDSQGRTVVTLTFSGSETDAVSAQHGGIASLADGAYQLTILSASVSDSSGQALAGGGPNGNYVSPTDTLGGGTGQLHLYRLFGDVTGDGIVDQLDLSQFRGTFNAGSGNPAYLAYLDADNSGTVDQLDLGQFRTRLNTNVF